MTIPEGLTGKALHKYLKDNKSLLIASKKASIKEADAFSLYSNLFVDNSGCIVKAFDSIPEDALQIVVTSIINTTNLMDSHSDVHIPGLWKKSLKDNREFYLIQEHKMQFDKVISDEVKAFTKTFSWRELGYPADGTTEALVFVSDIKKDRNEFMFHQYRKRHVKNHSVGMGYVKLLLAVNEPDDRYYKEEYEIWQKYIDQVVNREAAEAQGYFWPVLEAKIIEGSAVVRGSNWVTPTQSIQSKGTEEQPSNDTAIQPPMTFDLDAAIRKTTFLKF